MVNERRKCLALSAGILCLMVGLTVAQVFGAEKPKDFPNRPITIMGSRRVRETVNKVCTGTLAQTLLDLPAMRSCRSCRRVTLTLLGWCER